MDQNFSIENWLTPQKPQITDEAIDQACDRVEAFALVNKDRTAKEKRQAINVMVEALGLDHPKLIRLRDRVEKIVPGSTETGPALIGILLGLYIAEEIYKDEDNSVLK